MKYIFESGLWETDYLLTEILPKGIVDYVDKLNIQNLQQKCDVFVFQSRVHTYQEILKVVKKITPKIIICLSDEFITEDLSDFNDLGNYCSLFLRQHHHPNYTYTSNTIQIPLGYTNGCKKFNEEKKLNWSFFGAIKADRQEMIDEFRKLTPNFVGNSTSKEIMCKIYAKSFFVPCGRGNCSLNCFRLYEASMNGAIPIIVGPREEIDFTFMYEENPPWIFAETWSEALNKSKIMLDCGVNPNNVLVWWDKRIQSIRTKITEIL